MIFSRKASRNKKPCSLSPDTRRKQNFIIPLEPRIMFDAAALPVADAVAHEIQPVDKPVEPVKESVTDLTRLLEQMPVGSDASNGFSHVLVVVDPRLSNYREILAGLAPGARVLMLDPTRDAVSQITSWLAEHSGITSLRMLTRNNPGLIVIENAEITADLIAEQAPDFADLCGTLPGRGEHEGSGNDAVTFNHAFEVVPVVLGTPVSAATDAVDALLESPPSRLPDAAADAEQAIEAQKDDPSAALPDTGATQPTGGGSVDAAHVLLVIDPRISNYQEILAGVTPGAQILVLDPTRDGIDQISAWLADHSGIKSMQILSHGTPGQITIGGTVLTSEEISARSADLAGWSASLSEQADILLYGCDVASGTEGAAFIGKLAQATGADVAASTNDTGSTARGGDWTLESTTGPIESRLALTAGTVESYQELLTAPVVAVASPTATVLEPSTLNAAGASSFTLSGWTISDDGLGTTTNVTVDVVVVNTTMGSLTDSSGAGSSIAGGFRYVGTPGDAQNWVNQLRFTAADTELGKSAASTTVTVTVTDGETLSASQAQTVTVTPSNDPAIVPDGAMSVVEGSAATVVTAAALAVSDPEVSSGAQTASQIVYRLTAAPTHGYLSLNGARIGIGSIFTQAQVNAGTLVYVHTGAGADQNTADSFSVSVNDGATPQASSDTATVAISITPVNQAPTVSGGGSIYEGQPADAVSGGVPQSLVGNFITATGGGDPGDPALTVRITSLPTHGTLNYNGTAVINGVTTTINRALTAADLAGSGFIINYSDRAGLTYANDGSDPGGVPPDDSFDVAVTDGGGGLGVGAALTTTATINLDIRAINDDPVMDPSSTLAATVDADGVDNSSGTADDFRVVLTPAMLNVTDVDSPNTEITFAVTHLPTDGNLLLNGVRLIVGSTFTMDDVVNGRLVYGQTAANPGGANPTDQFRFRVVDNALSLRWAADGEDFTRVGGIYDGPASTDPLSTFTFTLSLAETAIVPTNNSGSGTGNDIPAPVPDATQILYAGDDPTKVGDEGQGFAEGGTSSILGEDGNSGTPVMLRYTAEGVPSTQVVYTVTGFGVNGGSWSGRLQRFDGTSWVSLGVYDTFTQADVDTGRLRYVHDGGEDFQQNFGFQVSAGGINGDGSPRVTDGVFTCFIQPVNDAPAASGTTGNLISEGDTKPITTSMVSFSDPDDETSESYLENDPAIADGIGVNFALNNGLYDGDPLQFRITVLPDHGKLQYDTTGTGTWVDIAAADVTNGTLFDSALITGADGTTRLRYVHDGLEDRADSFTVVGRDRWGAEGGAATVSFVITNVNDGPEIAATPSSADPSAIGRAPNAIGGDAANDPLTVTEGGTGQITASLLQGYDPDSDNVQVQYRITTAPTLGRLAYSTDGVTFQTIGVGSAFTQQDVANGYIYYLHNGTEPTGATPEDTFGFTIADGDKEQAGNTFHILVTPTNDAPTVSGPGSPINIDGAAASDNPITGFVVADPDLVAVTSGETDFVQVTVRLLTSGGTAFGPGDYAGVVLAATASNGDGDGTTAIIDSDKDGNGDYLVIRGSRADVNATLATLRASFPDDRDQACQAQVIVDDRLRDGSGVLTAGADGGNLNQAATPPGDPTAVPSTEYDWYSSAVPADDRNITATTVTLRASSVNDPATLTVPGAQTPTEDTAFTFSQAAGNRIVITDTESTAFTLPVQLTLSVTGGTITVGSWSGVTVSGNGTGTVVLTGTVADIQARLDAGITYQGNSNVNGADTLTVTLDENDAAVGGDIGSGSVKNPNLVRTVSLDLIPVNDAPSITAPTTVTLSSGTAYTFSGGVIAINDAADLGQGDPDTFTVTLTATGSDTVTLSGTAGLTFTTGDGSGDGTMTFSGARAAINAALNGLVYTPANANSDTTQTLSILVNDNANGGTAIGGVGGALTASRTVNLQVSAINEAPVLSVPAAQTTVEDTSRVFSSANGNAITVADPDDFGGVMTVTLSVPSGSLTLGATAGLTFTTGDGTADGAMTFSGTESAVNAALNGLTYIPPANFNSTNPVTLSLSVNDNGHTGTGGARTDSRTIDITVTPFNDAPTRTAASTNLTAVAEDTANPPGDTVTNLFSGRFSDALDNQTANSGSSANSLAGVAITANAATGAQGTWQYSTDGGASWTNLPAVSTTSAFIVASGDSLRFLPAANYNGTPGSLTVRLIDDSSGVVTTGSVVNVTTSGGTTRYSNSSNAVTLGTSVSPVNDAPTITGPITGTTYTENAAAVILASGGVVADAADSPANFNGGTLRASFAGYQAGDVLQISTNGTVTLSGGNVLVSGTIIGTYAGGTGSDLVITLNSNATAARINTVLQRLAFQSTSDDPTVNGTAVTRALTITFDDGGNTGSGGSLNSQLTGTITITPAQDAPVITPAGGAASYTENTVAITVDNTVTVTDADDTQITGGAISITSGFIAGDVLAVADTGNITGSYDAGTGVLTLTGTDTLANYQSVLRSLTYLNSTDDPTNNTLNPTRTVTYSLTDADSDSTGAATGTATRTINVTAINDVPVTAVGGGATPGYTENGAAVVLDSGFSVVSDADDTQIASATVQITGNRTTGDTLNFVNQNGITGSYNSATGLLTLTGTTSLANYQTALRSITFSSTSDDPTVNNSRPDRTITWTVTDANSDGVGARTSTPVTTSLNVTAVNDSPVIGGVNTNTVTYTENGAAVVIDQGANATVTDTDDTQIASAVIQITGNLTSGDTLNFTNQNGITGSYDAGTGTLTLTGSATLANYQTALRTITFGSTNDDPTVNGTVTSRTVTWQVTDANSDAAGAQTSSAVTSTITITPAQDAPVVTAGGSLAYTENQAAQVIDATVTVVSDADDTQMASATVQISAGLTTGDVLAVNGFSIGQTITGTNITVAGYNSGTGLLTLTGADTLANYTSVLRMVTFVSTSDDPTGTSASRTITWRVTDANSDSAGAATSAAVTSSITVTPINDAPTVNAGAAAVYTENGAAAVLEGTLTVGDADDTRIASATVQITGNLTAGDTLNFVNQSGITGSYNSTTGLLTLTGTATLTNYQAALRSVTFSSSSDDPTVNATVTGRTITWQVTDADSDGVGAQASGTVTSTITITPAQDAPVITPTGGAASYTENTAAISVDNTVTVTDADDTQIAGGTISITSGFLAGDELAVITAGTGITAVYDAGAGVVTLTGADTLANYQGVLRSLTFLNSTDDPTNNTLNPTRTITYSLTDADSDGAGAAAGTVTKTINVTAINDVPVTAVGGGAVPGYTENGVAVVLDSGFSVVSDADDTQIASATVQITGNRTTGDTLNFVNQNGISGSYNATTGTLTLTGTTTLANYQAALRSITFSSSSDDPTVNDTRTNRTITWTVTDANSDGVGAQSSIPLTSTITVSALNDPPTGVDDAVTVGEAGGLANGTPGSPAFGFGSVLTNDTDPDSGDTRTVSAVRTGTEAGSGTAGTVGVSFDGSYGSLILNSDGSYLYVPDNGNAAVQALRTSGQTLTETFTYTVKDSADATDTAQLTITIQGANDNPVGVNDTASAVEAGGIANGTPGSNGTGNVLTNDSDVDSAANGETGAVNAVRTGTEGAGGVLAAVAGGTTSADGTSVIGSYGTLTLGADGSYSYVIDNANPTVNALAAGATLTETFTYRMVDASGATDTAELTVTITGANDNPVAVNDTAGTDEDTAISRDPSNGVLPNDSDVDSGTTLVVAAVNGASGDVGSSVTGTTGGSFVLNADGSYSFDPGASFQDLAVGQTRTTSVAYTTADGAGGTATATLTITVVGTNDNPVGNNDTGTAVEAGGIANGTAGSDATGNVLTNDTDVDSGATRVVSSLRTGDESASGSAITMGTPYSAAYGDITLNSDGSYTYVVDNDNAAVQALRVGETLTETFTYTVRDEHNAIDTAQLTITIQGANDAPVANPDSAITSEDTPVVIDVVANDTDIEGDTLSVTHINGNAISVGAPVAVTNGSVELNADGRLTFTPEADFNGTASFTYTVSDGHGGTSTSTVNVTVNPIADIADDTATTSEDTAVTTTVLANDSFEGTPVVTAVTQGAHGTVVNNGDGTVTYTSDPDFNGTDSYTYTVTSPTGVTETATVNVTVNPVADIADDTATTNEDTAVTTTVLTNDSFEGTPVVTAVTQGAHGMVVNNGDGTVTYTPDPDFNGTDSYTYTVTSPTGVTEAATVNVTVNPVVDIANDTAVTNEDTSVTTTVLANDSFEGTPLVTAVTQGVNGTVTINADNTVTYTPNPDFNGTDSYTYTVTSPTGVTETATVNVTVNPVADIADDTATTSEDTAVTTTVLTNDSFEGTPVVTAVTQGANGTVVINPDNTVTYTPNPDFNGTDSYTYTVTSPTGVTETATVNVTVNPVVDIADDTATTSEDTAVTTTVLANDSFEGTPVVTAVTQGTNGTVVINPDNTVTYTPNPDFNGTDSYTYIVTSPTGITETATVNVTVNPIADIADDTATTNEDTAVTTTVLTNDSFEGTPVVTAVTQGANGTVVINPDNTVTYTPNADFNGTDSYTYTVTSPTGVTETATVNVTVSPVADITDDTATTNEDTAVTTTVLSNDSFEGTPVVTAVTQGANGTVVINPDNTVTYTPNADFNGTDSYTYTVTSPTGVTETATVNVTVNPVQDIADDTATTSEDTAVTTTVLTNDSFEGTPVVTAVTQGANGTVVINPDNTVTYTPNADFNGTDSYTYTVTSPTGVTETATVNVTVNPVVDIADDTATTSEDTAVTTTVLANDSFEGTPVVTAVTQGTHGTVVINPDNTVTYTPNPDFNGTDSYTYIVTSPTGVTETATVNVTVNPVQDIADDTATTSEDTAVTTTVLANDSFEGTPVVTAVTQGANGTVVINPDNTVTYTPNADFNGTDSYTYTVTSPTGVTETATVNVTVNPVVDIADDTATTSEDTAVTTTVLANDSFEGTPVVTAVTHGTNGTVVINPDNTVTYTPAPDFRGTDSYTYTVSSPAGVTETATVTVTVDPTVDIANDSARTSEDTPIRTDVLANDTFEGTPVVTAVTQGKHGRVTINADNTITYRPNPDYNGTDSYTYTVTSGEVTETATVRITVTPVVDIADDMVVTDEDTPVTSNVLSNDSFEGTPVVSSVTHGTHGTVVINPDNTITYTPDQDYNGTDTYTYTVTSPAGITETATVTVTVNPVNDPPFAVDETARTGEDTPITLSVLGNDGDIDGSAPSIARINGTAVSAGIPVSVENGSVTVNDDGTLTFAPLPDYHGEVSFTYTISDGRGGLSSATVTITVTAVPDIADDTVVTTTDTPVTTTVLANDDFEGAPKVTAVTQGVNGTVVINEDGTITYTPDPGFNGQDSYTYTVTSGGVTETATVTVTVNQGYTGGMVTPPSPEPASPPALPSMIDPLPPPAQVPVPDPVPDPGRHLEELSELLAEQDSPWLFLYGEYPPGCTDGLYLRMDPPPQEVIIEQFSRFQLPQGIFGTCRSDARVTLTATLPDDEPLPPWLAFNAVSGTFFGTAPEGAPSVMVIKLTAQDERGHRATATFTLRIIRGEQRMEVLDIQRHDAQQDLFHLNPAPSQQPAGRDSREGAPEKGVSQPNDLPQGRRSLSEQFDRHGRRGLETERQQMIRTLQKGFAARRG